MIDLCEYAVMVGEKAGADEIEALWVRNISTIVEAELSELSKVTLTAEENMRIRVIKDKALASILTYRLDRDNVKIAVEKTVAAARASKKDEHWDSLPFPGNYPQVHVWDTGMENLSSEDMIKPVLKMLEVVPEDILVAGAGNQVILSNRACVNSNGITHEDRGTVGLSGLAMVGILENSVTPAFEEIKFMRKYSPDPQRTAESLVTRINLFRKKKETASPGESQVIFSSEALEALFRYTLFKAVSGENVARGKSLLDGKEGEKIASSNLTLHDNGITPEGIYSREMDDEGIPHQDTVLIEKGVLQGFIWNDYWAKRTGYSSTGNAFYDDQIDEMALRQTTMVIAPGEYDMEELLNIKDGYYVLGLQGAHGSNPESGDFSVVCTPACRIRNGEITGGVSGMMVSGNVYSLLHEVDAVGRRMKANEISILPSIRFNNVNVAAQ
ncbi:MAG: TldD/PmbA family protein [Theionarchaea archaeon]|nr:TldD/PmbA family protein [Theionarchaea archaeon]